MPRKKRKSSVNKSGNYTKPALRKRIFNRILAANIQGTAAGKWSAYLAPAYMVGATLQEKHNY